MEYYNDNVEIVCKEIPIAFPPQHQNEQPAMEYKMNPIPISDDKEYIGSDKLKDKIAIITGGDSGIGRAVAIAFAKEGADISIVYYDEHIDAEDTKSYIESLGRKCLLIAGDLRDENFCKKSVETTFNTYGQIDIVVNNAGVTFPKDKIEDITSEDLYNTFAVNIFSYFYIIKAAVPYLKKGSSIINTSSSTAYRGGFFAVDYSSSKGAVVSFTRSLSELLVSSGIRVNSVAPGYTWTPLITVATTPKNITTFGSKSPMKKAAQPYQIAPAYVYLASNDSSYVTGQVLHVDGGLTTCS